MENELILNVDVEEVKPSKWQVLFDEYCFYQDKLTLSKNYLYYKMTTYVITFIFFLVYLINMKLCRNFEWDGMVMIICASRLLYDCSRYHYSIIERDIYKCGNIVLLVDAI